MSSNFNSSPVSIVNLTSPSLLYNQLITVCSVSSSNGINGPSLIVMRVLPFSDVEIVLD
jgi:hypothetical protein